MGEPYMLPKIGVVEHELLNFVLANAPIRTAANPRGSIYECFLRKVRPDDLRSTDPSQCWTWIGAKYSSGYGGFRGEHAHRASVKLFVQDIPEGLRGCHRCDNYPCVRPSHIFLGDQKANMMDAAAKGRMQHGEKHADAKLSTEQVLAIRAAGGTITQIAETYGVHHSTISRIKNFKRRRKS